MMYVTDGKTEHIEGEGYRSDDYPTYTLLLRFFDLIIDKDSDDTVYEYLLRLQNDEVSYEEACAYLPLFRLINRQSERYKLELIELFEFYESGRQVLADIFREQREHEESLYKTLYVRSTDNRKREEDNAFFGQIELRNVREPSENIWEFFIFCFDKLAMESGRNGNVGVFIGKCEKCYSHYLIRRVQHGALKKNHFCENCRNSVAAMMSAEKKRKTPLYKEYKKLYSRYYQQLNRGESITYQEFKDIMIIAGSVRDEYLLKGNTNPKEYVKDVETRISAWKKKK